MTSKRIDQKISKAIDGDNNGNDNLITITTVKIGNNNKK